VRGPRTETADSGGSQTGAFLIGAGVAILVLPILTPIFVRNPFVWVLTGGILVAGGLVVLPGGGGTVIERTNCPTCGARMDVDDDACEYCGGQL